MADTLVKVNLAATTAPTASDDETSVDSQGRAYEVFSQWVDVTNNNIYDCLDATEDAAIWVQRNNDILKVGTPANDEVAVWTGDGTLEGTSSLTVSASGAVTIDQDTDAIALSIDTEATTADGLKFTSPTQTSGRIINISNADALSTGQAIYVHSNSSSTSARSLIFCWNENTLATNTIPLEVFQMADQTALYVNQNGNGGGLLIDTEATTQDGIRIVGPTQTTGHIINIDNADGLTTGSAIRVDSNSADVSARNLVDIINDNAAATGAVPLRLQQDSTGDIMRCFDGGSQVFTIDDVGNVGIGEATPTGKLDIVVSDTGNTRALDISQNDTTNHPEGVVVTNASSNHGIIVIQTGVLASGDRAIRAYSNSVQNQPLMDVWVDNASSTGVVMELRQDGSGDLFRCYDEGTQVFTIDDIGNVGVGESVPTASVHIDQNSASGAKPVLRLDQGDIDDSFIDFIGTSAADGTRSISSDTTEDSAKFGAIRIEINGVTKWIRIYDDES